MPRDSRVEPLQFRHPKTGFRYRPGRNFSEKLEVVRVHLLEHGNRAGCPHEVDASGCRVILEVVGAAHAIPCPPYPTSPRPPPSFPFLFLLLFFFLSSSSPFILHKKLSSSITIPF